MPNPDKVNGNNSAKGKRGSISFLSVSSFWVMKLIIAEEQHIIYTAGRTWSCIGPLVVPSFVQAFPLRKFKRVAGEPEEDRSEVS